MTKNKTFLTITAAFLAASFLLPSLVLAQSTFEGAKQNLQKKIENRKLPQIDGIYDVQDQPDLKLGVVVHYQNPEASPALRTLELSCTDPDSSAKVSSLRWKLPNGTWNYSLNTASVPASVGSSILSSIVSGAFSQWSNATGSLNKVVFAQSSNALTNAPAMDGKNIIAWGLTPSNALGVTYTWFDRRTGLAKETDTIMNNNVAWTGSGLVCDPNAYDAKDILTHELGHWLGMSDMYSTNYRNATMYGYGSKNEIKKTTLSAGDILGVRRIYP